ncbi:MAG TPA: hypothetical protein ENN05_06285 [Deltaproteobacteria bacterium]|nr:hypothetical protein [Deltaproteobacteria bacterium]
MDLLTLSRRGVTISEIVNLNNVVEEYLKSPEYMTLRSLHDKVEEGDYISLTITDSGQGISPADREKQISKKALLSIDDYKGRGESILVVDDAKEQREIASAIFTELGYCVKTISK